MGKKARTIEARVIFKAMDIINGNACHFITFEEISTKERVYLQVGIGNYMMIVEGDRGELQYKEQKKRYKSKFKSFERAVYALWQESPIIEENSKEKATTLKDEIAAVLEMDNSFAAEDDHEAVSPLNEEMIAILKGVNKPIVEEKSEDEMAVLNGRTVAMPEE